MKWLTWWKRRAVKAAAVDEFLADDALYAQLVKQGDMKTARDLGMLGKSTIPKYHAANHKAKGDG